QPSRLAAYRRVGLLPDGQGLSCSLDRSLRFWDPDSGAEVRRLDWPRGLGLMNVVWSADGRRVWTASFKQAKIDGRATLQHFVSQWDTATEEETARFTEIGQ